ncbi:4'-phosphopantetheinyl transferase [Klebsiella pneumoniae]|uniref:4'-phosphopantetheinyl transferase family protein n=1 Tax=Klebsiella variicola TaxID=244366 RepID=UPI003527A65D
MCIHIKSNNLFISSEEIINLPELPSFKLSILKFNVSYYNDMLFEQHNIIFPRVLHSALTKRRAEYLAARIASKRILNILGEKGTPGTALDHLPIWPNGWCGSISHTNEYAVALISTARKDLIAGVDIEQFEPQKMKEIAYVFSDFQELELISKVELDYEMALLIIFSAKESLFKGLYPEVRRLFLFDAAQLIKFDGDNNKVVFMLTQDLSPKCRKGTELTVYYMFFERGVITYIGK